MGAGCRMSATDIGVHALACSSHEFLAYVLLLRPALHVVLDARECGAQHADLLAHLPHAAAPHLAPRALQRHQALHVGQLTQESVQVQGDGVGQRGRAVDVGLELIDLVLQRQQQVLRRGEHGGDGHGEGAKGRVEAGRPEFRITGVRRRDQSMAGRAGGKARRPRSSRDMAEQGVLCDRASDERRVKNFAAGRCEWLMTCATTGAHGEETNDVIRTEELQRQHRLSAQQTQQHCPHTAHRHMCTIAERREAESTGADDRSDFGVQRSTFHVHGFIMPSCCRLPANTQRSPAYIATSPVLLRRHFLSPFCCRCTTAHCLCAVPVAWFMHFLS